MNIFLMILTGLNILLVLGLSFTVFLRVKEKKEDQRITKGLQLLQHKISILQDLSDKTDEQVQRLIYMLDSKSNELRRLTLEANQAVHSAQDTLAQKPTVQTSLPSTGGLDELSQFVKALSAQNEKIKSTVVSNDLPQEFTEASIQTAPPAEPAGPAVRPYNFRRVTKV